MYNFNTQTSKLKQKLNKSQLSIGTWLTIPSQAVVEILGTAGFEWIVIDLEHSPIGIESALNMIAHIQANNMQALVRVSKNEEVIIKKVLDAGADGLIIPMINSKEDLIDAIDFIKYPPTGKRGVGLNRAQKYGTGFEKYTKWIENEVVIIAQIEHINAVNNLDEILTIECLDAIIIGPYDLSSSMGIPGKYNNDRVKNVIKSIEKKVKDAKVNLGFHVIESDYKVSLEKIKSGYTFLAFSIDFFFLGDMARNQMTKLKDNLQ